MILEGERNEMTEEKSDNQNLVSYILEMLQTWMDAVLEIGNYQKKKEIEKG